MYNEFKNLFADGLSKSAIARKTGHDRKTVRKYISMSEQELEHHLERISQRTKKLQRYEEFVRNRISNCIDCSAAQVEDWLKEHHPDFPRVSSRTVYSFVQLIRHKHDLPKPRVKVRACEAVRELPYGEQAQVDFGVSWMRDQHGNRVKVYFMLMVLSRSRQKFVFFTDQPVTTWFLILAMENAFVYFGGVPRIIVFDQDATILTSENYGELIFTLEFERYLNQRKFKVHMCRKADPQSKGKVENGVKYVKGNFLHGRTFQSMEQLNKESCQWLERTANAKVHGTTHLVPAEQWLIEKEHLQPYTPLPLNEHTGACYGVRKDNTVLFRGNRYTVPTGTYQGPDSRVRLKTRDGSLIIHDVNGERLATFALETGKGKLVINNNHRRERTSKIDAMEKELTGCFTNQYLAGRFLRQIRKRFPRYARDQFMLIKKTIDRQDQNLVDQTLLRCLDLQLFSGGEFKSVFHHLLGERKKHVSVSIGEYVPLMPGGELDKILLINPKQSAVSDYQNLLI